MKKIIITLMVFLATMTAKAQMEEPVKWSYASKKISTTEAVVFFKATIDDGWHVYSVYQGPGGPVKTSFKFKPSKAYLKVGNIVEPKPVTAFNQTFGVNVSTFEKEVVFRQKIRLKSKQTEVKGSLEYMACTNQKCLSPETVQFSIPIQ